MAKKNIKVLLNKYKEEKVVEIDNILPIPLKPKRTFDCEICKNFEIWGGKKQYCVSYDCYPFKHKIPVEEYCNDFILDKIKAAKHKASYKLIMDVPSWKDKLESDGHNLYDIKKKKDVKILISENNKNLKDNSKANDNNWEEYEDLDDFDIVYTHNNKKLEEDDESQTNRK